MEEYSSLKELYLRLKPAFSVKQRLNSQKYPYIKNEDIWNYLSINKWKTANNLSISEMVDDIIHVDITNVDNYLKEKLKGSYLLPYEEPCMHEFVLSGEKQKHENGVSTLNIAKALMDENTHPPTVYFPLIVHEAIMIEPTESENKEVLDEFVNAMLKIAEEAKTNPEKVISAPHSTPVKRLDETLAARHPDLKFTQK